MHASRQQQLVLIGSFALTALLVGGLVGSVVVWRTTRRQLSDPEFLQERLDQISPPDGEAGTGPPPALVRVAVAERKAIQPQRPIVGRLVEVRMVTVSSEVTGKIIDIPVEEGTAVTEKKTVLAKVDDVWCRLAKERCRAQVASSQADLEYESGELRRCERLRDKNAITESELESKQATVKGLQAKLDEMKAALEEESERETRCVILAPFNGTVVVKHAELGQHVSPGSPIVDVVSRGQVDARLMVPESIVNFINVENDLPIWIDPLGKEVPGKVLSVTPYGPSASRTFPVRVRLDDQEERLKVGMSVTAMIRTGPERKALVVSKDAVLVRPDGSTVWVAIAGQNGQAIEVQPVPVKITVRTPGEYAVEPETSKGRALLVPGTRVVIEGAERLMPGQQVRIVTQDGEPADLAEPQDKAAPGRPTASGRALRGAGGRRES